MDRRDASRGRPAGPAGAWIEIVAGGVVVVLAGEHDIATTELVERAFAAAEHREPDLLAVDLGRCTFMDSTVVAALRRASERAAERPWQLVLIVPAGAEATLVPLLAASGLDALLARFESIELAASALPSQRNRAGLGDRVPPTPDPRARAAAVAVRLAVALGDRDWEAAVACCHPDLRFEPDITPGHTVQGLDALRRFLEDDLGRRPMFDQRVTAVEAIADDAILVRIHLRSSPPSGRGFTEHAFWVLWQLKDGLVWREQRSSRRDALLDAYPMPV